MNKFSRSSSGRKASNRRPCRGADDAVFSIEIAAVSAGGAAPMLGHLALSVLYLARGDVPRRREIRPCAS